MLKVTHESCDPKLLFARVPRVTASRHCGARSMQLVSFETWRGAATAFHGGSARNVDPSSTAPTFKPFRHCSLSEQSKVTDHSLRSIRVQCSAKRLARFSLADQQCNFGLARSQAATFGQNNNLKRI